MTPAERARLSALRMMVGDAASQSLGMRIEDVGPGVATLSMAVRPDMLNGHGMCHGGFIFSLADSAFAFACNSYNRLAVAQTNQITYVDRAFAGERLVADAREAALAGRTGTYDVTVTAPDGRVIALFRGVSRLLSGVHFPETDEEEDRA